MEVSFGMIWEAHRSNVLDILNSLVHPNTRLDRHGHARRIVGSMHLRVLHCCARPSYCIQFCEFGMRWLPNRGCPQIFQGD